MSCHVSSHARTRVPRFSRHPLRPMAVVRPNLHHARSMAHLELGSSHESSLNGGWAVPRTRHLGRLKIARGVIDRSVGTQCQGQHPRIICKSSQSWQTAMPSCTTPPPPTYRLVLMRPDNAECSRAKSHDGALLHVAAPQHPGEPERRTAPNADSLKSNSIKPRRQVPCGPAISATGR